MGYRPSHKTYLIEIEEYPGLEVRSASTSLGKLMDVLTSSTEIKEMTMDQAHNHPAFRTFTDAVISWNIEHPAITLAGTDTPTAVDLLDGAACPICGLREGDPVPPTVAGLFCLDLDFVMDLILGWVTALTRVSQGKAMSTKNGGSPQQDLMSQLGEAASLLK
jgi:hypothetical protein